MTNNNFTTNNEYSCACPPLRYRCTENGRCIEDGSGAYESLEDCIRAINIGDCINSSSPTPTRTQTNTPTPTITLTPTKTQTNTPTLTITPTITSTPTNSQTLTPTLTKTPTVTKTSTVTPTNSQTSTPTLTLTPTVTATPTITKTSTVTPTITPTQTNTKTPNQSPTPTITVTPTQTLTSTPTKTPTLTPTVTKTPTLTPTVTKTSTSTPTKTVTQTPSSSTSNAEIILNPPNVNQYARIGSVVGTFSNINPGFLAPAGYRYVLLDIPGDNQSFEILGNETLITSSAILLASKIYYLTVFCGRADGFGTGGYSGPSFIDTVEITVNPSLINCSDISYAIKASVSGWCPEKMCEISNGSYSINLPYNNYIYTGIVPESINVSYTGTICS
jgi:hypothetical protein